MLPLIRIPIKLQLPTSPFFQNLLSLFFFFLHVVPVQAALFRDKPSFSLLQKLELLNRGLKRGHFVFKGSRLFSIWCASIGLKSVSFFFCLVSKKKGAESNQNHSSPKNMRRLCLKAGLDPGDLTVSRTHVWGGCDLSFVGFNPAGPVVPLDCFG